MNSLTTQPLTDDLLAAYKPIVFSFSVDPGPSPVNFCDIYFNDIYYKSISRTYGISNTYDFDIQDACQEFLSKVKYPVGGIVVGDRLVLKVFCRFRSTFIDPNGLISSIYTTPIQGTLESPPVSGTGLQSNTFYVLNSVLQQDDDWNFKNHLGEYKQGVWQPYTFPLSHARGIIIGKNDSAYFPLVSIGGYPYLCTRLHYKLKGESTFNTVDNCPVCVSVSCDISSMHNWAIGFPYLYSTPITGSGPFTLESADLICPSWMTVEVIDNNLVFSGTPDVIEDDINIQIGLSNYCGYIQADTIIDIKATMKPVLISNSMPSVYSISAGPQFGYQILLYGSLPMTMTPLDVPAWFDITFSDGDTHIEGTPVIGIYHYEIRFSNADGYTDVIGDITITA